VLRNRRPRSQRGVGSAYPQPYSLRNEPPRSTSSVGGPRGILDVQGFDGFHLLVFGDAHNGFGHFCLPCQPGDSLSLAGDFQFGFFQVEGGPIPPNPPWQPDFNSRSSQFDAGNVIVPPLGASAILWAPFKFTGRLRFRNNAGEARDLELFGRGTGTVELRPEPGLPLWEFARARYEFAPVPEPATPLLVSSGLAAVAWRRGRRTYRRPE
jgi:PEP-CTERM motif-containing protein